MELLLESLPAAERLQVLKEQHHSAEQTTYFRPLSEEELVEKRETYFQNEEKRITLDEEMKVARSVYKKEVTTLKEENRTYMQEIRTKQEQRKGTLFHMANHETGYMETYNEQGEFISTRKLRPNEKQTNIYQMPQTGN